MSKTLKLNFSVPESLDDTGDERLEALETEFILLHNQLVGKGFTAKEIIYAALRHAWGSIRATEEVDNRSRGVEHPGLTLDWKWVGE